MKMEWHKTPEGNLIFSGEVSRRDLAKMALDKSERDAISMPILSASELLSQLSLLFRASENRQAEMGK